MAARRPILLVFPPLTDMMTHPELGVPQLTAWMRRAGWDVRQLDLNATCVFRHLADPDVRDRLRSELSEAGTRFLDTLPAYIAGRKAAIVRRVLDSSATPLDPEPVGWFAGACVEHQEVIDPLPLARQMRMVAATDPLAPAPLPGAHTDSGWLGMAKLVNVVQRELIQPCGFAPGELGSLLAAPCPWLDRFLAEHLDPLLPPDLGMLGLSIHNAHQLVPALRIADRVRALRPGVHVTLGGPWAAAASGAIRLAPLVFDHVDTVVACEGEVPLESLALALAEGRPFDDLPGVTTRHDGAVRENLPPPPVPLGDLPVPVFDGYPMDAYPDAKVPFRTVRGCYWGRCAFCFHVFPHLQPEYPTGWRADLPERVTDNLLEMLRDVGRRFGARTLTLADNATPPAHMARIATALVGGGLDVRWEALARFDPGFTPETFRLMALSGCRDLFFGLETASPPELARLRKGITPDLVVRNLRACAEAGIHAQVFVLHYPSQPLRDYIDTLEFLCEHHDVVHWIIPFRFRLGRNAMVFDDPGFLGVRLAPGAEEDHQVFHLPFEADAWMGDEAFREVTEAYFARFIALRAFHAVARPAR
ncbi:MAG: hypothetical protein FJ087_18805 [Deltaproteobacteria bacterium]|nr:hypothetical protein [Deltaproteobacteria bacterium]